MQTITVKKIKESKLLKRILKVALIAVMLYSIFGSLFAGGLNDYYSYKDYSYQNSLNEPEVYSGTEIQQTFTSKGNLLSKISLYIADAPSSTLFLEIVDENDASIFSSSVETESLAPYAWNTIPVNTNSLKRGDAYTLKISGNNLRAIVLTTDNSDSKIFGSCFLEGKESPYFLAVGISMSQIYMPLGTILELIVKFVFVASIAAMLCYAIIFFEKIFAAFKAAEHKQGFLYALYFSVYAVLLFNPIDSIYTEVTEFSRIMGAGLVAGVDVSKRIGNFNRWFVCLAIVFALSYLLANYFKSRKYSDKGEKAIHFLDNIIVIANAAQLLRIISYFYNEAQEIRVFYYSEYLIMALILATIAYIVLGIEKKMAVDQLEQLILSFVMLSYPTAILFANSPLFGIQEWDSGRLLMGIQIVSIIFAIIIACFIKISWTKRQWTSALEVSCVGLSFVPFCTSFFIELVPILNRYGIFIESVQRDYFLAVLIGILILGAVVFFFYKKNIRINNWKAIAYPIIVFGVSCLWKQIEVSQSYNANLFETANSSILISDFLNFGDIPIVQHYGGHMMTGVWEGIAYGLINNDYTGAIFSPYSGYVSTLIAVLFYFLLRNIWDEDSALITALFFPFYGALGRWGLGILMCLTAIGFVKKNSYARAVAFWLSAVWCVLYRLDLGFAFVIACLAAFALYIIIDKNKKALKELLISLIAVGLFFGILWCVICLVKGINPVNRLVEFLLVSASNQNWAFTEIGNNDLTMFAWAYLIVPFAVVIGLMYIIFSSKFREGMSRDKWVLLLILGFSFICNYQRGLVRHSLVEKHLTLIMWTAYLFFTVLIIMKVRNPRSFLPVFAVFILCHTLFLSDNNFSEKAIADNSAARIGNFVDTWHIDRFADDDLEDGEYAKTIWMEYSENQEVIERVKFDSSLNIIVNDYQVVLDALLEDEETYVDFINKTFIYSAINRQNPVYISQSPMQISGEFTQEEFVKEIEGVPLVLMPRDARNLYASEALDGIPNSVRCYKIAEYIYQNYVPLCTYETDYAIWCLTERYDEMSAKVEELMKSGTDIKSGLISADLVSWGNVEAVGNNDGTVNVNYTGTDPIIYNIQNLFDISQYVGGEIKIAVDYITDVDGVMQFFYTTNEGERYTSDKVVSAKISGEGTAYFTIPGITKYTHIRMDTPEESSVRIKALRVGGVNVSLVDYGYDGPFASDAGLSYSYLPSVHNYSVGELPVIWAECDKENSIDNPVVADAVYQDGLYTFNISNIEETDGNYLRLRIEYPGNDISGKYDDDDETTAATLTLGYYANGIFETKYLYSFTVKEGAHDYLFRVSNDYYWYLKEVNAARIECSEFISNYGMDILQGD